MQLKHGLHLAYCTNIHPGETWAETFAALNRYTLRVRDHVSAGDEPYAIGLRLSDNASRELIQLGTLLDFKRWLKANHCYVFTINGFPYGQFHGTRVKEQVYRPDWTTPERLDYTNRLFTILAELLPLAPVGCEGSVSTLPGSFKRFNLDAEQQREVLRNVWRCVTHIERLVGSTGRGLHLGLEPEPLGLFETTSETVTFFDQLSEERPDRFRGADGERWRKFVGVNYDTCHMACQYEEPAYVLTRFRAANIRVSKIHISSALRVIPTLAVRDALRPFGDDVYLHQVIAKTHDGSLLRYLDLNEALADTSSDMDGDIAKLTATEWRIHFHVPLHMPDNATFGTTSDANRKVFELLAAAPNICPHLEMETYTWGVLPHALKSHDVVEQLASEYAWTLGNLSEVGLR